METLTAVKRAAVGKKVRQFRRAGFLPAVVYGQGQPPATVNIVRHDFQSLWRRAGESTLVALEVSEADASAKTARETVLIHDVALDPLSDIPLHVDFLRVNMREAIRVSVPLAFTGQSPAVAALEGVLVKNLHEVEVEALPEDLPKSIEVDITALRNFEDQILLGGLRARQGVKIIGEEKSVVVAVQPPRSAAELESLEAKPAEALPEIELSEKRGKQEEGEQESAEASEPAKV